MTRFAIIAFFLLILVRSASQESVYIPSSSTVHVGNTSSVGVFGHFINDGNLSLTQNSRFYFLGKIFRNNVSAVITDGTTVRNSKLGGNVIFQQPNPVYGNLGAQLVESGYRDNVNAGPSFSSITVNNPGGIWLTSDMNVLDAVNFQNGHVYLNKYVAALGDSSSFGGVNGYNEQRYFVTGTDVTGGALKVFALENCCIVTYPVGTTERQYTPLQMRNTGGKNDFYVRAFDNVYSDGTSGQVLNDTTLKVTWTIVAAKPGNPDVDVLIQNDRDVETATFNAHRERSYISMYKSGWEQLPNYSTPQTPGTITSTAAIFSAIMNYRKVTLSNKPTYLTKRVLPAKSEYFIPNAFSPNGDGINDKWIISFIYRFPNARVEIFNRGGQPVFSAKGNFSGWDGTIRGAAAPVGTYYYIVDLRNGQKPLSGYIALLR